MEEATGQQAGAPLDATREKVSEDGLPWDTPDGLSAKYAEILAEIRALRDAMTAFATRSTEISGWMKSRMEISMVEKEAFDSLYSEMADYKEKFLYGLQKPLLKDLLLLYDSMEKQMIQMEGSGLEKMRFVQSELVELLHRQDLEFMDEGEAKLDRARHRVIKTEETADPAKDRTIAKVIRKGFMRSNQVIRPEEVIVWTYKPAAAGA